MTRLSLSALALSLVLSLPAAAQSNLAQPTLDRLEAEGYEVVEVTRSWLGRILITARSDENLREVVLNRRSGEVLRDKLFALDENGSVSRLRSPEQATHPAPRNERPGRLGPSGGGAPGGSAGPGGGGHGPGGNGPGGPGSGKN